MKFSNFISEFKSGAKVVLTTHKSPDGDAIGSMTALGALMQQQGYDVSMLIPDAYPDFLAWMDQDKQIINFESKPEEAGQSIQDAEWIFSLDYNRLERIGDLGALVADASAKKVMIDHHIDPDQNYHYILSDTSASSTAELIYRFADGMGWTSVIDEQIAACLYAGIMTDTGSFRFASTGPETHRTVAALMEKGLRPEFVHQQIFDTNSLERLQLIGYALEKKTHLYFDGRVALISLSLKEKNRFAYKRGYTEGLVNYGLSIKGVDMSIFLSEELGFVKMSFRSKGEINVNQLARENFNGGGHKNAAGGKVDGKVKEAETQVLEALKKFLHEN